MTDLSELKRLHAAATKCPWVKSLYMREDLSGYGMPKEYCEDYKNTASVCFSGDVPVLHTADNRPAERQEADATWIAAIHNAFPQLAATIETQAKEIERLKSEFKHFIECALTVRDENTPEWLEYFAEKINSAAEVIGESDRFQVSKHGTIESTARRAM